MQSIYRFREAEVGLFIETQQHGIGDLKPESLTLKTNFRSDQAIVEWFNRVFRKVMGEGSDATTGAVQFKPSTPWLESTPDSGIFWHDVAYRQREDEGQKVAVLVAEIRNNYPDDSIGILVRSRSHAREVCSALRDRHIDYTATDLENLDDQQVVQDLLALTRAVTHLGDRLAWLACLRAPWTGLLLEDLHILAAENHETSLWQSINDPMICGRLSDDGQVRLAAFRYIMAATLDRRGAIGLRELIEGTWVRLHGPQTLNNTADFELVGRYLALLGTVEQGSDCIDGAELLHHLAEQPITRGGGDGQVQVMTMHKAKGLEFDSVILPCLGYKTRTSQKPVLLFHELPRTEGEEPLVVAPITPSAEKTDPLFELLWRFEQQQEAYELKRLLYVATTRARHRLHLFAQLQLDSDDTVTLTHPDKSTLLAELWSLLPDSFVTEAGKKLPGPVDKPRTWERKPEWFTVKTQRLRQVARPELPEFSTPVMDEVEFEWASLWARHVGTVVHRWLQQIATQGVENYNDVVIDNQRPALRRKLCQLGTEKRMLQQAENRVADALKKTLSDQKGRWMLSDQHEQATVELPFTNTGAHDFEQSVIDRTFVCADGIRWIIDYKTSSHEGGDLQVFLASEATRYRPQLSRYRDLLRATEDREIRTALYFPLLQVFHLVDCDELQRTGE
jgi:ATP-dependent exoDNAse (exonuclease V) beta subunit